MSTFLFDDIIFGPIKSRRLGVSLGVNLLPTKHKICNYNCIYCECGWSGKSGKQPMPKVKEVTSSLEKILKERHENGDPIDSITFAGNGEPTVHTHFAEVIDATINLRNQYFPKSIISVLTNGSMLHKHKVVSALHKIDNNIIKLDGGTDEMINLIDQPLIKVPLAEKIPLIKQFSGECVIQTIFLRGEHDGMKIDNTTDEELNKWIELVEEIAPKEVMIYAVDRDTPTPNLEKLSHEELEGIAEKLRAKKIKVLVA